MPPLCLLTVHAHPDDESSKGAGTVALYHAAGVHTVLVCATGGEAGDILNPAMDQPGIRERIHEVRRDELAAAADIIGFDEVVMLGYRDSGMPDTPTNNHPDSFAQAPLDEAVERLVAVIRRTRPQVVLTYPRDQSGYPHPDHIRVNVITELAFDAAADAARFPAAGPPWQPVKMYYSSWPAARVVDMHRKFVELGLESPVDEERLARSEAAVEAAAAVAEAERPTVIALGSFAGVSRRALLAHATQIDPTSKFWFGLPPEVADTVHPYDEFVLARSLVDSQRPEDDLFAGVADAPAREVAS